MQVNVSHSNVIQLQMIQFFTDLHWKSRTLFDICKRNKTFCTLNHIFGRFFSGLRILFLQVSLNVIGKSPGNGPCRSDFSNQISIIQLNSSESLRFQILLKSVHSWGMARVIMSKKLLAFSLVLFFDREQRSKVLKEALLFFFLARENMSKNCSIWN